MNLLEVKNLHKDFVVKRSFWGKPKQILRQHVPNHPTHDG